MTPAAEFAQPSARKQCRSFKSTERTTWPSTARLVAATRPGASAQHTGARSLETIHKYLSYGASPRASQYLVLGAKGRAILAGKYHVDFADIQAVAAPVLRHRLVLNFHARADNVDSDNLISRLLEAVGTESGKFFILRPLADRCEFLSAVGLPISQQGLFSQKVPEPVVAALAEAGLFRLLLPRALGGAELEVTGRFSVSGRNLPSGPSVSAGVLIPWVL